jgi:dihydroorotate dehydrogenase electron transfer subunit
VIQQNIRVDSNREIADGMVLMKFDSGKIASTARPGQFLNIRASQRWSPLLLRRPFSISRVAGTSIELLYNIVGMGTRALAAQQPGDEIDVLGPLGVPFGLGEQFETAVVVAGGLGIAPFPFLTDYLEKKKVNILTFLGSRSRFTVDELHLRNVLHATDDGSQGFKGNVVEMLADYLKRHTLTKPKIFGCGPTKMLSALSELAQSKGFDCELSLEGDMACGIGICQGCPVERNNGSKKYALVCTDGPTFDCRKIKLSSA